MCETVRAVRDHVTHLKDRERKPLLFLANSVTHLLSLKSLTTPIYILTFP